MSFLLSNSPANSPFVGLGLFLVLVLRSWLCGLAFGVGWVVVSFSLADYTQKERAQFLASSLVLLWCVQILVQLSKNSFAVYLAFSSSFGW